MIASQNMVLSAIRIPVQWCPAETQRAVKTQCFTAKHRRQLRRHRSSYHGYLRWFLLPFLFSTSLPKVNSMPYSNHVLISGDSSADTLRQQAYIHTIVSNTAANISACPASSLQLSVPTIHQRTDPFCFIADTNSNFFCH